MPGGVAGVAGVTGVVGWRQALEKKGKGGWPELVWSKQAGVCGLALIESRIRVR